MKFTIISGSPKGKISVSLQYLLYIQKHFPQYSYDTYHVGQKIKSIEKKRDHFDRIIESISTSDGVLWITPVYYFLIPAQLKRFIELVHERNAAHVFRGKYTTVVTTSIRFFDITAHNYLHAVCDDLGMKYAGFNSLDMWDIFRKSKRKQFLLYAKYFFNTTEKQEPVSIHNPPLDTSRKTYTPGAVSQRVDSINKAIVILTDELRQETNLGKMINRFADSLTGKVSIVQIKDLDLKGGCLGCVQCGYDNQCIYKDNFTEFWQKIMKKADIIIFAGEIRDRYLSSDFKMVFDRSFFMNHRPYLTGKQMGFLISGPLNQVANLKHLFSAYVESQMSNLLDFVTDEYESSDQIDSLIYKLARNAVEYSIQGYIRSHTFYREGGMKIFRDDIYGRLRYICQADHRWYQKNGIYDTFPQNNKFVKDMNRKFMFLTRFKKIRKKIYKEANRKMVKPLNEIAVTPGK